MVPTYPLPPGMTTFIGAALRNAWASSVAIRPIRRVANDGIALQVQGHHVAAKKEGLGDRSEDWEGAAIKSVFTTAV
jgi:hypothetical protein